MHDKSLFVNKANMHIEKHIRLARCLYINMCDAVMFLSLTLRAPVQLSAEGLAH